MLIYHAADYHNPRVISETWENLINSTHYEIEERRQEWEEQRRTTEPPPLPFEVVSSQIQTIAHRTSLDSLIFPIETLLPIICEYAINNSQDASVGADPAWPVLLLLQLGVSHALIARVLDRIFETQEAPFTGRRRKLVVQWIDVAVEAWVHDVERRGTVGKGEGAIGAWVSELLGRCDEVIVQIVGSARTHADAEELAEIRRVTRSLKRSVDSMTSPAKDASLFFR